MKSETPDLSALWSLATENFVLGPRSDHGPKHWRKVERNGLALAAETGADRLVVRLFAVLHDSKRRNEFADPEHGPRAAAWAAKLRGVHFQVSDAQFDLLCQACREHDQGHVSFDATIGTCWDADRLELPRVEITPDPEFMSTPTGKRVAAGKQALSLEKDQP
jgi:uncharacterized protein